MRELEKAKWIWQNRENAPDEYVEFSFCFAMPKNGKAIFNIAADSNYVLYINGRLASFGQYADYPDYKVYDSIDISEYLEEHNTVSLLVWYYGIDTQTYIKDDAGVIFDVISEDTVLAQSDENIDCRLCDLYANHRNKRLTVQLGQSFKFYGNRIAENVFSKAVRVEKSKNLFPRPNERLRLGERRPISVIDYSDSYLIDLGRETVGFVDLDFESDEEQEILISYGEYLFNNQVRRVINGGALDFSVEYVARKGENKYCNYFRRIAGRYLQVYHKKPIKIRYIGVREVEYPVKLRQNKFKNELRQKIYDTSLRTLRACMHEHFEDCPWREQALYTLDSRNEMLAAYAAFDDFKFIRSNLSLISHGLRKDGLLCICYPSGLDFPIPFFSLAYAIQLAEYIERSGDVGILEETFETVTAVMRTFVERIDSCGLIAAFPCPYWNFYEWTAGSVDECHRERTDPNEKRDKYDLILNCMFLHSMRHYKKLCAYKGVDFSFDETGMREAIQTTFFDRTTGLYKATTEGNAFYTTLGNSLAILCDIGGAELAERIVNSDTIVPITLSMSTFLYEALLKVNGDKYKHFILADIDRKYSTMLNKGATTFWETEDGASALGDTGTLCHGWSSMPIYYYTLLNQKEYFDGSL